MMEDTNQGTFKKKKKGKSFLQKQKRFGKQGQRGKGTNIEQDDYDYLVRVLERWRDGFDSDDEKIIFVGNVMNTTEGKERLLAGNQLGSRVIEMLLPSAESEVVDRFSAALGQDLRLVCLDPFMSHVLEKLLILQSFTLIGQQDDQNSSDWLMKVSKFVTNNAEDFCNNMYASHLLRTVTECLVGVRYSESNNNQSKTQGYDERTEWRFSNNSQVIQSCDEVIEVFSQRLSSLSHDQLSSELCVRVISVFCHLAAAKHCHLVTHLLQHILNSVLTDHLDLDNGNIVRLCETLVTHGANTELSDQIQEKIIKGKEVELACHPTGNFIIQRLLDTISDKEVFVSLVETVSVSVETILGSGCTGVILALVKAAVRLSSGQTVILNKIIDALHCQDSQDSVSSCLVFMVTKENLSQDNLSVHLHGSVILQQLLLFSKPIKLVRSLLSLPAAKLSVILSDPRGCHITDSFMTSSTVGEKSRESLVKSLKGEFVSLATSKHGTRTLDSLWKHSSVKSKQVMVEELSSRVDVLNSNKFGFFIVKKWFIQEFKRNKSDWLSLVDKENKIVNSFSEIIGDKVSLGKRKNDSNANNSTTEAATPAKKKEVADLVDDWLKPESAGDKKEKKEKKKKAKSYLDDL